MGKDTICLQCGDIGCINAFVYCVRCLDVAVHRYCLDIIPKTVDEFVHWICDDCHLEKLKKPVGHLSKKNVTVAVKKKEPVRDEGDRGQSYNSCAKHELIGCAESSNKCCPEEFRLSVEKKRWNKSSSQQLGEEKLEDNMMLQNKLLANTSREEGPKKKKRIITLAAKEKLCNNFGRRCNEETAAIDSDSTLSSKKSNAMARCILSCNGSSRSSEENTAISSGINMEEQRQGTVFSKQSQENKHLGLGKQCSNMGAIEGSENRNNDLNEIRESEITEERTFACNMENLPKEFPKDSNITSKVDCYAPAEPVLVPIWRGSFNIWNRKELIDGLMAHISSKACQKVYEEAGHCQPVLQLEMLPKSEVWPKSFETSEPSDGHIALYFFPSDVSERVYDSLVDEMVRKELAMRVILQNAELLVFTSMELQLPYWRFKGKYYLWGVFKGKPQPPQSCKREVNGNLLNLQRDPIAKKCCGAGSGVSSLSNSCSC